MQEIFPRFYSSFRCIANRCEDSCCKDWDIDIDSKTEAFYQSVQGELGEKIRRKLVTDDDGERVFRAENGRCPFWNQDMLCDIFIGIGEEHLSETCAHARRSCCATAACPLPTALPTVWNSTRRCRAFCRTGSRSR